MESVRISLHIDGQPLSVSVHAEETCLDMLRYRLKRIGACEPCPDGRCGACMVLMDGEPALSCQFPAVQVAGSKIVTAAGLGSWDEPHPVLRVLQEKRALQCGFCTPAMLLSAVALLRGYRRGRHESAADGPSDTKLERKEVRRCIGRNLCYCRSYDDIEQAVMLASERLRPEDLCLPGEVAEERPDGSREEDRMLIEEPGWKPDV